MRVYLPASIDDIEHLINKQTLAGRSGYGLLPEWAQSQPDQDPEVLEEELVYLAANDSLSGGQRVVLVAELNAQVLNGKQAQVSVEDFSHKHILALFGDDLANKSAILGGADPAELDLTWFGPTETLEFRDFLQD